MIGGNLKVTVKKSWHTAREWFVYVSSYRGEVMYYPASMRWHARPWRASGRPESRWFDDMQEAVNYVVSA